ncbi:MAG TPA: flagellar type III secretion system pore protein FliP [Oleiagrimonas sp.]|nr:flagellar type III secretion system pore protein FliP [Oleiagrimonas sp.]
MQRPSAPDTRHRRIRTLIKSVPLLLLAAAVVLSPHAAHAAISIPALSSSPTADGGHEWSLQLQTLLLLTSLMFLPAVLLMMTCFTRIIIVLGLLRTAIGTHAAPPNQVLLGLTLFLTLFVMAPTIHQVYNAAWAPLSEGKISFQQALDHGSKPLHKFMMSQTRKSDLKLFTRLAKAGPYQTPKDVPLRVLVPAYVTSELKTAFQIGFTIFIPFLIIDLVVASVLMSLGMMMVPPSTISLPFKLMLFVLVDGWHLIIGSLVQSFHP